jgi:hypothetical protein
MKSRLILLASVLLAALSSLPLQAAAVVSLVSHEDLWQYRKGTNAPQTDWKAPGAVLDSSWRTGRGAFGCGATAQETNQCQTLLPDMVGSAASNYTTLYLRKTFTVTNALAPNLHLLLRMDWDDGYIAWLDGVFLTHFASPGAPAEPAYNAVASNSGTGGHESSGGQAANNPQPAVTNDLGVIAGRLGVGEHVLTIIGLNMSKTSGDFIQVADLSAGEVIEPPPVILTNCVSGTLATDTTWYSTNGIYTITGQVTVATGATLTIEPGVTVWTRKGFGITVLGRLLAEGTDAQPITFTRHPADLNWERIQFIKAADSRFRHCVIQYANCAGDHKNTYYATNCAYPLNVAPRNYFEAVVALACHVDFEDCVFTNLYTADGTLPEGDAIGIFSDDLVHGGPASAHVQRCQFRYIGQGVHARYAYVLVEDCYFIGKTGDNDDVEMHGESSLFGLPSPHVRNNVFDTPCYDDRIHPTRCSAIIEGNIIYGDPSHGDHAIVLRDTCCPIVFNNVMYNCPNGGITVQNGCDALIVNNTFVGINSAIKLFDHTSRLTYPYCLSAQSGRATVLNCIVWNGNNAIDVSGASGGPIQEFRVNVSYSDIQNGTNSIYHGSNTRYNVQWGPGNLSTDPLLVSVSARDARLSPGSPCINTGTTNLGRFVTTNTMFVGTNRVLYTMTNDLDAFVTHDLAQLPRPLDGTGGGVARFDMGAHEYLLPTADSNGDGIPDGWTRRYGFSPLDPGLATADPDRDGCPTLHEYVADTDPTNAASLFRLETLPDGRPAVVGFSSSSNRLYTLYYRTNLTAGTWAIVPGQADISGAGGTQYLSDTNQAAGKYYRVGVRP